MPDVYAYMKKKYFSVFEYYETCIGTCKQGPNQIPIGASWQKKS